MSFVASAIKAVVNVVEDVVETVVGVVEDVADFVVEEIIEPVVEVVDTVVTAVIEDPVATILTVAAAVTPGMSWTIPLINAADTVAKGGNIGDAVKAAAIGYVAPKVGSYVSGAVTGATGSVVAGNVAGATATGVVKGKSLKDALISGAVPEIASASLDVVKNNIPNYDTISSPGADSAIEKGVAKYIESGGNVTEAALAAASTNLGTVLKDNTNFNGDISNALSAGLVAGLQDPEAALPTFKASLNAAGVKDLNAKIDDYLYTPSKEEIAAEEAEEARVAEEARLNEIADNKLIEEARVAEEARLNEVADNKLIEEARVAEEAKVTEPSSVATAEEEMGAPIERSEDLETLLANYEDTSAKDFAISNDKTWENVKFADTSDLGKAFTSETDLLDRETAFDDSKNIDVATIDDDLTGLLLEDKEIKTSPLGGADAIARKNLIDAGKESGDFRDLTKFEDSFADIEGLDRGRVTKLELFNEVMSRMATLGLNASAGLLDAVALSIEGGALNVDAVLTYVDPSGDLTREVNEVWVADSIPLTIPSMVRAAEEAGIKRNEMSEVEYNAAFTKFKIENYSNKDNKYAGLSNNEKRKTVDEIFKKYADNNPSNTVRTATSGVVESLESTAEFLKENINDDMALRMYYALPAKNMDFTTALPGGEVARDRFKSEQFPNGRPYGTDYFATFANASEEFGDVAADMVIGSIPYVGPALILAGGQFEGQAAAQRTIEEHTAKALANGDLEGNVAWQQMLSDVDGDEEKALFNLNKSFYKTTLAAGSLEAVGDFVVAKTAIKTMNLKTIKDIQTKLDPAMKKVLGITGGISLATGVGGLTEAGQEAITAKALRDFGIDPDSEVGAAFLLGAAGQGGAVSTAKTAESITNGFKSKYKKGTLSKSAYDFVEREIINPNGSEYDPDFITVDERRKADAAFKTAEEARLEPSSLNPAFEAAGLSPTGLSPTTIAKLESAGVSPANLSPTTIADLEATGEISSNLNPTTIAELEAAGVSPASLSPTEIAELEAAGVSPASEKTITIKELADADINLERNFADLEGEYSFTTARGSEYKVNNKGKGIRNRFNEEANKYKLETETQKTIFMEANRATDAFQSKFQYGKDPLQFIPSEVAGKGKLVYTKDYTDKDGVFHVEGSEDELIGDIDYSLVPEVGMIPIDIYNSKNEAKNPNPEAGGAAAGIHFGSKITSLGTDNFKSSITTNEVMKTFYPDLDIKPEADDVSSIVGKGATQPDSSIDIFGKGEVDPRIPDFDSVDPAIDKFGPGEVDPRIPDFDTPSLKITPEDVAAIIGGNPEDVTSDDVDAVTETVEAIETEINAETAIDATISPVISVNTDLPEEDEERRRRRKKAREQAYLQATGQSVDPNNIAGIDYLYDFESKFANPQQIEQFDLNAGKFNRPYDLADIIATGEQTEPQRPATNEDFLQLIDAAKMNPDIVNQETRGLDLFPVDETEKIGINSPYTTESKEDTTQRLLNLINNNKA